jgi:hypothetical protein
VRGQPPLQVTGAGLWLLEDSCLLLLVPCGSPGLGRHAALLFDTELCLS